MADIPIKGVVVSFVVAWLIHVSYRFYKQRTWFRGLPQPPSSFLWGHLQVMGEVAASLPPNTHYQIYLTAIAQKYNLRGIWYLDLWPLADSHVVLTDPDLMTYITVTKSLPIHPLVETFLAPMLGQNVIAAANGALWKKLHTAMAPAFSWSHIRFLTNLVIDESEPFRQALRKFSTTGESFSMVDLTSAMVFDVTGRIIFNFPLHAQTKGSSYLTDLQEMVALAEAQLSWNPLVQIKIRVRRRIVLSRLHKSIQGKIRERLALLKDENIVPSRKDPYSILDLMLREQVLQTKSSSAELSSQEMDLLVNNVKALLVGGQGTTADTLCWTYLLLSKSPETVEKLREEHTRVFSPDTSQSLEMLRESPTKLNELPFTTAVITEVLRLFPVGITARIGAPYPTLTYDGKSYPIDNDLAVVPNVHTLHYDPDYFPDPSEFNPERFMDEKTAAENRALFRTFGRGPRACPGRNLGVELVRIFLFMTIRDYDFECTETPNVGAKAGYTDLDRLYGDAVFQEFGVSARPKGKVMMRVRKRTS